MPERIQLSRKKGWRKPENTVVVSRPSKWGNPFSVAEYGAREAVRKYEVWLRYQLRKGHLNLDELRGKNLACWCRLDQPCHADFPLALANG